MEENKLQSLGPTKTGIYIPPRVAQINAEIAAQGNKGYSVAPTAIETPAKTPTGQTAPTLPEPTAPTIQENYITSLTEQQKIARKTLEDTYKTQKADVDKQLEEAKVAREGYIANTDPTTRPTYEQETRVMQNQLDAAEASSKTIQKNFEDNQKLVDELDKLLTEGNQYIESQKGPGSVPLSVSSLRTNRAIQEVSARVGVIEAVMSARNGQINQAHNIINQAKDTVAANWKDQLNYYDTLLKYNEQDIISLDEESKAIAEKEVGLIENDLKQIDANVKNITDLMTDPDTASFMAKAGITLLDTPEQVGIKMGKQAEIEEIEKTKNELVLKGYTPIAYQSSTSVPVSIGGKTMYFEPPKDKKATQEAETREEYAQAEEFVNVNPEASDAELKSALLRDSNLSVTDINAIIASRQGKVTLTDIDAKNVGAELIQENFEKKFWSSRSGELESAKEKAKKELDNLNLSEGDKQKLEDAIDKITIDDIEIE